MSFRRCARAFRLRRIAKSKLPTSAPTRARVLCRFAEKIGGLSSHNCYNDGVWRWHAYIMITWNGKTKYYIVCPPTRSGIVSYSTIDFTKLNNVLHFNPDALVGLNKVAALSDDFEVLSADDGATYDEITFGAVADDAQTDAGQAVSRPALLPALTFAVPVAEPPVLARPWREQPSQP